MVHEQYNMRAEEKVTTSWKEIWFELLSRSPPPDEEEGDLLLICRQSPAVVSCVNQCLVG